MTAELLGGAGAGADVVVTLPLPGLVQSCDFLGMGHPVKLAFAEGQMVPSGQHWLPAHKVPLSGQDTEAPALH